MGVRLAADVTSACSNTPHLYGADILIVEGILLELLNYELQQAGLNLTHSQDKDYVRVSIFFFSKTNKLAVPIVKRKILAVRVESFFLVVVLRAIPEYPCLLCAT